MKSFLNKFKFKRNKKEKTNDKKKYRILETCLIVLMIGLISAFIMGVSFIIYIAVKAPQFDPENMYASEASIIYFNDGSEMQRLGTEQRENVTYDDLPQVFIDALLSTEDARFFQHGGVDIGRFAIATLKQLGGNSDAGGASTLTMQVVGHTFTDRLKDEGRIQSVLRKFTDVYMAVFQLERRYTKEEIMEFYVNIPYLGCGAWGVEQAAAVYFNKTVSELTLVEAATIAGLFQAPDAFDPCRRPDLAEQRRNQVLRLMVRHGYLTEENYRLARAISVESTLAHNGEATSDMQGAIDTIVSEVKDRTGFNPYNTSMQIYSTIDPSQQEVINNINNGTLHNWPNDKLQVGIAVIDVDTGAISAIGTGRNQRGIGNWNYATQNRRHPGSTAKPIFSYGPAIEYLDWSTGQLALDEPHTYSNGQSVRNWDGKFQGLMTIRQALASSRNIPALYTFQQLTQNQINNFATGLGITPEYDSNNYINEAHSFGAFTGTNAVEMAAAYAAFARGGIFIEPHSFTKVVFTQTEETFRVTPERRTVMSEDTAFLINQINMYAITAGHVQASSVSGTNLAGKTGTSSFDPNIARERNFPSNAIRDSWTIVYSPDIIYSVWLGYAGADEQTNCLTMTSGGNNRNTLSKTLSRELNIPKNSTFRQPSGVVQATIELETNPIKLASEFTPTNLRSTEWFKRGTVPEESTRFSKLDAPSNLTADEMGSTVVLSWNRVTTPDFVNRAWLTDYFRIGYASWADQYLNRRLAWNESNIGNFGYQVYMQSAGQVRDLGWTAEPSFTYNGVVPSGATFIVKSSYSIFKSNQSNGVTVTVTGGSNNTTPTGWTVEASFPSCITVSDFLNHQSIGSNFANINENGNKMAATNTTLTCTDVNDSTVSCLTLDTSSNYILNVAVRHQNETKSIRYNVRTTC